MEDSHDLTFEMIHRACVRKLRRKHLVLGGFELAARASRARRRARLVVMHSFVWVMIILLLFLQKQNLAFAVYLFGSVLSSKRLFRGPSTLSELSQAQVDR